MRHYDAKDRNFLIKNCYVAHYVLNIIQNGEKRAKSDNSPSTDFAVSHILRIFTEDLKSSN